MGFVTTSSMNVEGHKIETYYGLVYGKSTFPDIRLLSDSPKDEATFYEEVEEAIFKMVAQAKEVGANAVIGVQTEFYNTRTKILSQEIWVCMVSGTAVTIVEE